MTAKPFTAVIIAHALRARRLQALSASEQARREALKIIETIERNHK